MTDLDTLVLLPTLPILVLCHNDLQLVIRHRSSSPMIYLPPSPPLDPWASSDEEGSPSQPQAGPSRNGTRTGSRDGPRPQPRTLRTLQSQHPLHTPTADLLSIGPGLNGHGEGGDVLSDVSRPALTRLTSETERQVAESSRSGSERGSLDLLRMSTSSASTGGEEVEVLIHKVSLMFSLSERSKLIV
jgi:hypothetical protein